MSSMLLISHYMLTIEKFWFWIWNKWNFEVFMKIFLFNHGFLCFQDICRCSVFYADKMSKKVENIGDVDSVYEKKFEVTNEVFIQSCLIIPIWIYYIHRLACAEFALIYCSSHSEILIAIKTISKNLKVLFM